MPKTTKALAIKTVKEVADLLVAGETEWQRYGAVRVQTQSDLTIFCYHPSIIRQDAWNYFETISRGLIINNKTGEIVARPFDKFFNWLQGGRASKGHIVSVTEKMDGSLGILYRIPDKSNDSSSSYRIASKASFTSDQALWGTSTLQFSHPKIKLLDDCWTLIFEMIYPENRIVLDYGERRELVLLAIRNRFTGEYAPFFPDVYTIAKTLGFSIPKTYTFNAIEDIVSATGENNESTKEGWVVEFSDSQRFKFKTDRYIEVHRALSRLTAKNMLKAVINGTSDKIIEALPDEFVEEALKTINAIRFEVSDLKAMIAAAFMIAPKPNANSKDRKKFAKWVYENHEDLASYLFALYDGQSEDGIDKMIYKRHEFEVLQNR